MRILKRSLPVAFSTLTVLAGGCENGRDVLFDEDGTWSLILFDIEGGGLAPFDSAFREDQFLLHFDAKAGVLAAASCLDSMGRTDLTSSLCDVDKFECRCFEYTYEQSAMTWTERPLEGQPDTGTTAIRLESYPERGSTYRIEPLPVGLFDSDGMTSRYAFQARSNALFEATGCLDACGISDAE